MQGLIKASQVLAAGTFFPFWLLLQVHLPPSLWATSCWYIFNEEVGALTYLLHQALFPFSSIRAQIPGTGSSLHLAQIASNFPTWGWIPLCPYGGTKWGRTLNSGGFCVSFDPPVKWVTSNVVRSWRVGLEKRGESCAGDQSDVVTRWQKAPVLSQPPLPCHSVAFQGVLQGQISQAGATSATVIYIYIYNIGNTKLNPHIISTRGYYVFLFQAVVIKK